MEVKNRLKKAVTPVLKWEVRNLILNPESQMSLNRKKCCKNE